MLLPVLAGLCCPHVCRARHHVARPAAPPTRASLLSAARCLPPTITPPPTPPTHPPPHPEPIAPQALFRKIAAALPGMESLNAAKQARGLLCSSSATAAVHGGRVGGCRPLGVLGSGAPACEHMPVASPQSLTVQLFPPLLPIHPSLQEDLVDINLAPSTQAKAGAGGAAGSSCAC